MGIHVQRTGICLAVLAWLVQLSVFLTPLFSEHTELGFSVCYQLEDVVATSGNHHGMMNMSAMTSMSHAKHQQHPTSHQDDQCQICSLMAHLSAIDLIPAGMSITLLVAELIQVKFRNYILRSLGFDHLLLPPGRAPPIASFS